jgi:SAM-dependent methyltransferase
MTSNIGRFWKNCGKCQFPGLDTWLQSPQGRYVMAWEQARIDAVGRRPFRLQCASSWVFRNAICCPEPHPPATGGRRSGQVDVFCDLRQLPFAAHSIDLVVMAHVLEFHDDPHQILREVERVLIPEGEVLIITGFNPISIWGLRRALPTARRFSVERPLPVGTASQGLAATARLRGRTGQLLAVTRRRAHMNTG